jgi:Bacterial dnaA protein helix-turn-helix
MELESLLVRICEALNTNVQDVYDKPRYELPVYTKKIFCYFANKIYGYRLVTIGKMFEQDHTTVSWHIIDIQKRFKNEDLRVIKDIQLIKELLGVEHVKEPELIRLEKKYTQLFKEYSKLKRDNKILNNRLEKLLL